MRSPFSPKRISFWIGLIVILIILTFSFSDWIVKWLWLKQLGYQQIFVRIKLTQIIMLIVSFIIAAAYIGYNLRIWGRHIRHLDLTGTPLENFKIDLQSDTANTSITVLTTIITVIIALLFSFTFFYHWDTYFRFNWEATFGSVDPIFHNDLGYYVFRLPFIQLIQNSLTTLTLIGTGILGIGYFYSGLLSYRPGQGLSIQRPVTRQLSLNLSAWLLMLAWGFYLDRYNLLYHNGSVVYGANYTDIHVILPTLWVLVFLTVLMAGMVAFQWYRSNIKWVLSAGVAFIIVIIVGRILLPVAVNKYIVKPNELKLETPYLKHNIALTRKAYKLDHIKEKPYQGTDSLTQQIIQANTTTIHNIRLWDPRLLIQTYRQIQEIRSYYQFYSVDVGRYHTKKGYREMMLSGREIADNLPQKANTWVNRHLQYTHGYGLVMSPVAEKGSEGVPHLVIKNLPPVSKEGLKVTKPSIYYGEHQSAYAVVNTKVKELDYPKGNNNVYTHYSGTGGVPISNFWRRFLFAYNEGDANLFFSNYITHQSRIQLWRSISQRVHQIAPFLKLEDKPYLVLNDGKLYWIQDAYTTSADFPYSEPYHGVLNYIRNSVKVVVSAFNGTVNFYVSNKNDPVLKVYRDIFPGVFKPLSAMPAGIRKHIRYPEFLFKVQINEYNTYHMTNPQVFYNNEDLWERPTEKYGGSSIIMEPYYVLAKLPGDKKLQYMLMSPLTPNKRDNMIAWMAAMCDAPNYGNILVYKLPKERLIYGPSQIEAQIDQNTEISQQLSLWDQRGSNVIRGNLMVIPINKSFIYVEPVFLLAEGVQIPQLQRVIVAYGDKISMQPTLQQAINVIFGKAKPQQMVTKEAATPGQKRIEAPIMNQLRSVWKQAQQAMKNGDWQKYGSEMNKMRQLLQPAIPQKSKLDTTRNGK
ncbi:MAG TPA: UPF0182 family protein [Balneolales bacterium]|nr:UPF0182 family protein [Balneolales bacterium]